MRSQAFVEAMCQSESALISIIAHDFTSDESRLQPEILLYGSKIGGLRDWFGEVPVAPITQEDIQFGFVDVL